MKNWSLNAKLTLVMTLFAITAISVTTLGIYRLNQVNENLNQLTGVVAERVRLSANLDANVNNLRNIQSAMILETELDQMQALSSQIENITARVEENILELEAITPAHERAELETVREVLDRWQEINSRVERFAFAGEIKPHSSSQELRDET